MFQKNHRNSGSFRAFVLILVAGLIAGACSGSPAISESDHALAAAAVSSSAAMAGIDLAEADRGCAVDHLSTKDADQLVALFAESGEAVALPDELSRSVAEAVVRCVGTDTMIRSGILAFAGDVSDASLACTGERFNSELLGELISSLMAGQHRMSTEIEIEISLVLGVCLSPEELLSLHQG